MWQLATKLENDHKIYQMAIEYTKLFRFKALQNLPKLGFWFENIPSGNPDLQPFLTVSIFPSTCNRSKQQIVMFGIHL
jgi:hypothetical protein